MSKIHKILYDDGTGNYVTHKISQDNIYGLTDDLTDLENKISIAEFNINKKLLKKERIDKMKNRKPWQGYKYKQVQKPYRKIH